MTHFYVSKQYRRLVNYYSGFMNSHDRSLNIGGTKYFRLMTSREGEYSMLTVCRKQSRKEVS